MFPWGRGGRAYHSRGIGRQRLLLRQRRPFMAVSSAGWGARASKKIVQTVAKSRMLEQTGAFGRPSVVVAVAVGRRLPRRLCRPQRGFDRFVNGRLAIGCRLDALGPTGSCRITPPSGDARDFARGRIASAKPRRTEPARPAHQTTQHGTPPRRQGDAHSAMWREWTIDFAMQWSPNTQTGAFRKRLLKRRQFEPAARI